MTSVSEIELDCLDLAGRVNGYARLVGASLVTYPVNGSESYETALLVGIVTPPLGGYSGCTAAACALFNCPRLTPWLTASPHPPRQMVPASLVLYPGGIRATPISRAAVDATCRHPGQLRRQRCMQCRILCLYCRPIPHLNSTMYCPST